MSRRPWKARTTVYIVVAGEGFRPQRPWSMPDSFTEGRLYARNLTTTQAKEFVRVYNATAIKAREKSKDTWDHKWAIVAPCIRRNWHDGKPSVAAGQEGGVA